MQIALFIIIIAANVMTDSAAAQNVNWKCVGDREANFVYAEFGYSFGVTGQFGYGRLVNLIRPIALTFDYSMPMGGKLIDDFKMRLGGQMEIIETNSFVLSGKVLGNFRRHQTSLVRIASFGGEFALIGGYYRPGYHVALELGSDGAVVSHMKHSAIMVRNFPQIYDGWYLNNGVHYFYGIQGNKTVGKSYDVSLRLGKTNARGSSEDVLPIYAQLGLMKRF